MDNIEVVEQDWSRRIPPSLDVGLGGTDEPNGKLYNMSVDSSLTIGVRVATGNKVSSVAENHMDQDWINSNAFLAEHNTSKHIHPVQDVCISPRLVLKGTPENDSGRSRLAVRASECAGGHIKSSDVRARNEPRASREGGLQESPCFRHGEVQMIGKQVVKKSGKPFLNGAKTAVVSRVFNRLCPGARGWDGKRPMIEVVAFEFSDQPQGYCVNSYQVEEVN